MKKIRRLSFQFVVVAVLFCCLLKIFIQEVDGQEPKLCLNSTENCLGESRTSIGLICTPYSIFYKKFNSTSRQEVNIDKINYDNLFTTLDGTRYK